MAALVTPVMIVRDEETYLPGALEALRKVGGVLSAPCVYDTGSVDTTRELAAGAGAVVHDGYWDDDFSRARNEANRWARTSWILWTDADERLVADGRALRRAIVEADARGFETLVIEVDDVRNGQIVNTAPSMRFFRPEVAEFRNRIHESVYRRGGGELATARLPRDVARITHLSYGVAEKNAIRAERNARIGHLEVEMRRGDGDPDLLCEALVNRARSLALNGDHEAAERDLLEARAVGSDGAFALYAGELLAGWYVDQGRIGEATAMMRKLRQEGSEPSLVAWVAARAFAASGRPDAVVASLREISSPHTALGEALAVAPIKQARMLAAAELGQKELALGDAVDLIAVHGIYGFARLALLLWEGTPAALGRRLAQASTAHLDQVIDEFHDLGDAGAEVADHLRRWRSAQLAGGRARAAAEGVPTGANFS